MIATAEDDNNSMQQRRQPQHRLSNSKITAISRLKKIADFLRAGSFCISGWDGRADCRKGGQLSYPVLPSLQPAPRNRKICNKKYIICQYFSTVKNTNSIYLRITAFMPNSALIRMNSHVCMRLSNVSILQTLLGSCETIPSVHVRKVPICVGYFQLFLFSQRQQDGQLPVSRYRRSRTTSK